jgi:hypothetical protein
MRPSGRCHRGRLAPHHSSLRLRAGESPGGGLGRLHRLARHVVFGNGPGPMRARSLRPRESQSLLRCAYGHIGRVSATLSRVSLVRFTFGCLRAGERRPERGLWRREGCRAAGRFACQRHRGGGAAPATRGWFAQLRRLRAAEMEPWPLRGRSLGARVTPGLLGRRPRFWRGRSSRWGGVRPAVNSTMFEYASVDVPALRFEARLWSGREEQGVAMSADAHRLRLVGGGGRRGARACFGCLPQSRRSRRRRSGFGRGSGGDEVGGSVRYRFEPLLAGRPELELSGSGRRCSGPQ